MKNWSTLIGLVSVSVALMGCQSRFKDFCTQSMDCQRGNDQDIDACIAEAEAQEAKAAAYDCSADFDSYFDCAEQTLDCSHHQVEIDSDCGSDLKRMNKCIARASDLGDDDDSTNTSTVTGTGTTTNTGTTTTTGGGDCVYKTKLLECCAKYPDAASADACANAVNSTDFSAYTPETCQAAADQYTCPY